MEVYTKEYKIRSCEVDMHRRLRLSQLFTFTQEAAIEHTEILGAGRAKTLDRGFLWVVTMQHAEIKRLPEYDEEITLKSWAGETMHVMFPRFFEILDKSGECIIRGSAVWMLIDAERRSMIFPDKEGISVKGIKTDRDYPLPRPPKMQETDRKTEFTVPFSYSDINGHLTNTKYFDIAEDLISLSPQGRTPKYVTVEYSGEARYSESFEISYSEDESSAFFAGEKPDGKKVFKLKFEY